MYLPSEPEVMDRLADLGQTATEIATTLARRGICGIPGSSMACPVANYLRQCYPDQTWFVGASEISTRSHLRLINPEPVHDFIEGFDDGDYPNLELGAETSELDDNESAADA